jgi:hypothetical protein
MAFTLTSPMTEGKPAAEKRQITISRQVVTVGKGQAVL